MLFLCSLCAHAERGSTRQSVHVRVYIFNKRCALKVWRFSLRLSPAVHFSRFARFTRFASLDRSRIVLSNSKKENERKTKKKKKINNSSKSTFFSLSLLRCLVSRLLLLTTWWTQVIREGKCRDWNRFTIIPVYRTTKAGEENAHIHGHPYTVRMMMMMMIQFYRFNEDRWSFFFLSRSPSFCAFLLLTQLFHRRVLFLDALSHVYNRGKLFSRHTQAYRETERERENIFIYISPFYYVLCLHLLILALCNNVLQCHFFPLLPLLILFDMG